MKGRLWIAAVVVLGGIGWYLFRPELLFIDRTVNETLTTSGAGVAEGMTMSAPAAHAAVATGRFHSVAHETKGTATIHDLGGGHRVLRLTDFTTSNGPDVRVYLIGAADATDNDGVTKDGFVELGKLKGNVGDQNYDLPADLDLSKYHAVTIWCYRFNVNFATAPLNPAS